MLESLYVASNSVCPEASGHDDWPYESTQCYDGACRSGLVRKWLNSVVLLVVST